MLKPWDVAHIQVEEIISSHVQVEEIISAEAAHVQVVLKYRLKR